MLKVFELINIPNVVFSSVYKGTRHSLGKHISYETTESKSTPFLQKSRARNGSNPQYRWPYRHSNCRASRAKDVEQRTSDSDSAGSFEGDKSARQPKKLKRFTTAASRDYRQALLNFQYTEKVKDGVVSIRPQSLDDLSELTELLTEVFVATDDKFGLYTRYMRREIRQYLQNHLRIAPDAIVLVARLHPHATNTSDVNDKTSISHDDEASLLDRPLPHQQSAEPGEQPAASGLELSSPTAAPEQINSKSGVSAPEATSPGVFVGTVEMAFTAATRTRFLTLNPPQDCAYLGNMCVKEHFRRRGYGKLLLKAGEDLTRLAAFPTIYLHLRFKDVEAAAMYEAAGYTEVKRDLWLLTLIGYTTRFLMAKDLEPQTNKSAFDTLEKYNR